MRKNNELWLERLNLCKEYIDIHHKFIPLNSNFEYKGVKIGQWIINQKTAKTRGGIRFI